MMGACKELVSGSVVNFCAFLYILWWFGYTYFMTTTIDSHLFSNQQNEIIGHETSFSVLVIRYIYFGCTTNKNKKQRSLGDVICFWWLKEIRSWKNQNSTGWK